MSGALAGALGGFVMGFFGSVPLTGPIAMLVFRRGLQARYRSAMGVIIGGASAELVYVTLAIGGVGTLVEQVPVVADILEGLSAALLFVIGLYFVFAEPKTARSSEPSDGGNALRPAFAQGFSLSILNPVLLLNWSAAVAVFYSATDADLGLWGKVLFVPSVGIGIVGWFAILLAALRRWRHRLPDVVIRWTQRAMGVIVLLVAGWIVRGILTHHG